jgi:hypothetical protein
MNPSRVGIAVDNLAFRTGASPEVSARREPDRFHVEKLAGRRSGIRRIAPFPESPGPHAPEKHTKSDFRIAERAPGRACLTRNVTLSTIGHGIQFH